MNLNENKLAAETNLRRNVHLISTNGGVATNPNLINSIGPELCLDVDSSSNSENNSSSQPSSKISIQRLFRRRRKHPTDTETKSFLSGLADKLFNLKQSVRRSKLSNYVSCLATAEDQMNNVNEQYTISNQLLNSHLNGHLNGHLNVNGHLNPIFIDQLDCQDTSIKECAFRQYSSTLKHNQISLVRLQNAQRAARLIKASNCQFNNPFNNQFGQFDPINHFVRQQLITSSMKSDSLLISTRRQIVRDQLIKTIRQAPNPVAEQQHGISLSNETPSSQLIQNKHGRAPDAVYSQVNHGHRSKEEESKQFYYFAQHCFTLPQNHHLSQPANGRHQMVQPDAFRSTRETFGKSPDICLNASDTASSGSESGSSKSSSNGSSNKSSSENSTNAKTNCGLPANLKSSSAIIGGAASTIHESDLERKANRTLTTTTADIHLNKNFKKVDAFEVAGFGERFTEKEVNGRPPSANKLSRLKGATGMEADAKSTAGSNADVNNVNNSAVSLKYIVIDDAVFAD